MKPLRYTQEGARDLRLDLIRGYAVFAISVNHFGMSEWLTPITGGAVFLINAAEVFFFISGLTLGMISARKPIAEACGRCYRRAFEILMYVLLLALAGAFLFGGGERALVPMIANVLTLREARFWGDVLVAYVAYLAVTPAALLMLKSGRWRTLLGGIIGVYTLAQLAPGATMTPPASFRNLAANAPVFLGAIVLGWHREAVSAWFTRGGWRRWVDPVVVVLAVGLLASYATGYFGIESWANWMERQCDMGTREYQMPPVALAIVTVYLRALWLLVDRFWGVLRPALGWLAMPFGRDALFAYAMHAVMMEVARLVFWPAVQGLGLGWTEDTAMVGEALTLTYLALMVLAVRGRLWIGDAIRSARTRSREGRARNPFGALHGRVLPLGTGVAVASAALLAPGPLFGERERWDEDEEAWGLPDWAGDLHDDVYAELSEFDTARGAVTLAHLPVEFEDEDAYPDVDRLGDRLAEIIWEELGEPEGPLSVAALLDAEDLGLEPGRIAELLAERDLEVIPGTADGSAATSDVLVFIVRVDPEDPWSALERLRGPVERSRAARDDSLVVIAAAVSARED